jgi:hypothetical protein
MSFIHHFRFPVIHCMELLAQLDHEWDGLPGGGSWLLWPLLAFWGAFSLLSLVYGLFWLWMLIQCIRTEPDKHFWIWLLIVVPFPGAIIYAVTRYFPATDDPSPAFVRKWRRRKDLARLEAAAAQIGNAHQFIQWGDALKDVGRWHDAGKAYRKALQKDPENLQALWGAALVEQHHGHSEEVAQLARRILDKEPHYKFGDVSLALGKALADQGQSDAAREHLNQHVKRWRHPEGLYLLAVLSCEAGDPAAAQRHLRSMLQDLNASPAAIARKHARWKSRAKLLLRKLPFESAD